MSMLVPRFENPKDYKGINLDKEIEHRKSSTRCKVEHAFLIVKQQMGYSKVAYRGIAKNLNQFFVLLGCANLIMCIRGGICVFSFEFGWVAITLKERGWLFNCFLEGGPPPSGSESKSSSFALRASHDYPRSCTKPCIHIPCRFLLSGSLSFLPHSLEFKLNCGFQH